MLNDSTATVAHEFRNPLSYAQDEKRKILAASKALINHAANSSWSWNTEPCPPRPVLTVRGISLNLDKENQACVFENNSNNMV